MLHLQYGGMARPVDKIMIDDGQSLELQRRIDSSKTSKRDHLRAEIILLRCGGMGGKEVASKLSVSENCVSKWTARFKRGGIPALADKPGRGRKPSIPPAKAQKVVSRATQPPMGKTRWSTRSMAKAEGISRSSVQRIWSESKIKPHRTKTFKVSNDPRFEEKFWDVIGLYLDPPDKALVLCCDEKSQCQALERTQPGLPLGIGHIKTQTHDYTRHGTTTLFAALDYVDGTVLERTEQKHTHVEWLGFLKQIDRETPKDTALHLIVDNYSTHKHKKVTAWLEKHPRFHMHFTPTSSSWLNLVERFFADITSECIRDGSFDSVRQLEQSIKEYIAERNLAPKPYRWVASGKSILEKINRARTKLNKPIYESGH
jgi:transposase